MNNAVIEAVARAIQLEDADCLYEGASADIMPIAVARRLAEAAIAAYEAAMKEKPDEPKP